MQVTIDGVPYAPASVVSSRIGIAISTHQRADVLKRALEQHMKHLPAGALVVVVDDGSKPAVVVPHGVQLLRHETSLGIVASKNASLTALMDAGCEHLFLWDDDAWPIADNWHLPYIESPEPHLAYQFLDLAGTNKLRDMAVLHRDDKHIAYTGQRGVMLYYHRSAIEKVGGFDRVYGRGMYEHPDLALRIHNAGLSTWAFADVVGSEKLIHSMDEHEEGTRSIPRPDREALVKRNVGIFNGRRDSGYAGFASYSTNPNLVITTLLTSQPDPQRGGKMKPDRRALQVWADSISGALPIVLADELKESPTGADLVEVPLVDMSPYFARWLHIYQFLRAHPEYHLVWCTDGTDVEMLREPWAEMEPGKIYVGSEHKTYADEWMKANHHGKAYSDFIQQYRDEPLLNAGLLGGSREDVMEFAHRIIRQHYLIESHRFWKMELAPATLVDMGAFGMAAKSFGDRIVTGPKVHTIFKTDGFGKEVAWFRHK
ncbi:glycosyltransferase family 2 protein [Enterobacter hormaechei]|uniref:glycosyltransferase family 2 protein n=1 Tax=Enterobacter cloacae complex TaxID=354276 RepID=UPI0011E681D6|nr:glycosyltransferase family 2 protein [Enterobacter hormaechei]HBB4750206.1 glycosyltransferase family 2 protein [Enterobacter cloacae]EIY1344319.1 glycosyltransferase family 2 protein [Enterobacter hormaechei]EIY1350442.1 glycosyltransferase family 2 protein [Enterobacter hormaechei]EIY1361563.1 glycosyltransferase family 2 protein [Enterobacter hormaechei]EKU3260422.1 glycosyltransferase family 2 protein [Enterobacter hormaechei]